MQSTTLKEHDPVNKPKHYRQHPSGVECIQITEHMSFTLGNAIKYIWRADLKNGIEDLEKAKWYLEREIEKRKLASINPTPNQLINRAIESIQGMAGPPSIVELLQDPNYEP